MKGNGETVKRRTGESGTREGNGSRKTQGHGVKGTQGTRMNSPHCPEDGIVNPKQ
jgi:hypothetical protein